MVFLIVWFVTILVFFSLSSGKRPDYILPLYPAASLMVGQLWFSLIKQRTSSSWRQYLRVLSLGYFVLNFALAASLALLLGRSELIRTVGRFFPDSPQTLELMYAAMIRSTPLFLLVAALLAGSSVLGGVLALRRHLKAVFMALLVTSMLYLLLYFQFISEDAGSLSGYQKKDFCSRAAVQIQSGGNLRFCNVAGSLLFYLKRNVPFLRPNEVLPFLKQARNPYIIISERAYQNLRLEGNLRTVVLERSEFIISDETRYLLISRR